MSTNPLATIFNGDVTLQQGSDITQFGWGDLFVNRKLIVFGTEESTGSPSTGTLVVTGGAQIGQSLQVLKDHNVLYGVTRLTETHIDTTNNPMTVTGGNAVSISVGGASQFVSTSGNLSLISQTQSLQLFGGLNSDTAVNIQATHAAGGVKLLSGSVGGVSIVSGSGGITETTSNGNISLTANNGAGSFSVNSSQDNQNLSLAVTGSTDSQVRIESSGTNATRTALVMKTTNSGGNIEISNNGGLGSGSMQQLVGSGGYVMKTNTGGSINVTSQGAGSSYLVESSGNNQHLTVGVNGVSDSALILRSSGTNTTNAALQIKTTAQTGNIEITQPSMSLGQVKVLTGNGGFNASTQTGGSVNVNAYGASSLYTNSTLADDQNLTVSVTGDTNSRVIISSTGKTNDAVRVVTTNGTGGIYMSAAGAVQIESNNTNQGILIGTGNPGTPITIGTNSSNTTILGNLFVRGNTSTVNQQVVTIDDNIIQVNNAPFGTADGGMSIKRFQEANDTGTGDVVQDVADESGTVQNGGNTVTSIKLDTTANSTNDYYNGWWVKITGGTGQNQVRKIKAYDGNTRVATIYSTSDQSGVLGNPQPVEGLDFTTVPNATSTYDLFPCHYVLNIWDESRNEFALVCSSGSPASQTNIAHYSDLHINDLVSNSVYTNSVNGNLADISFNITLNDGNQVPIAFPSSGSFSYKYMQNNYGVYLVFVKPVSNTQRAHAIFMIGRVNASSLPGTVVRIISVKGVAAEQLDIQWRANEYPELYYKPHPIGGSGNTVYQVKLVTL